MPNLVTQQASPRLQKPGRLLAICAFVIVQAPQAILAWWDLAEKIPNFLNPPTVETTSNPRTCGNVTGCRLKQ
ncbi:MAG: hypothetical protein WBB29_22460 [Geitlerinemataceae cyanobacterium]